MASKKRLTKSKKDKIIFGVIGGVGEYYDVDATLLRIGWLVIVTLSGFVPGIVTYAVAAVVMR